MSKGHRATCAAGVWAILAASCLPALGQASTFTGIGKLDGHARSRCLGVSADGTVVAGQSFDANDKPQAVIWTVSDGVRGLGFLNPSNADSTANGVDLTGNGTVHATGVSKNNAGNDQAFLWSGNVMGVGTMTDLPLLPGGSSSVGRALRINLDEIFVVGRSGKSGGVNHAFRWRSGAPSGSLDLGDLPGGSDSSDAYAVGWRPNGTNIIAGASNSTWWVGGNRREAFRWSGSMDGIKGLDWVCERGFQVVAGQNGIADTTAAGDDVQVYPVGTSGLEPDTVVVSSGPNRWLNCRDSLHGDDELWPKPVPNQDTDVSGESLSNALSRDGRFSVGRCTYPDAGPCGEHPKQRLFQANLHDLLVRDGEATDHCGGLVMHFPVGFLPGDNYSEAFGVSQPELPEPSRQGLTVVGWSQNIAYGIRAGSNGVADSTAACDDVQEIPVGTTGLASTAIVVSPGPNGVMDSERSGDDAYVSYGVNNPRAFVCFVSDGVDVFDFVKDMRDLKAYLEDEGLDLSGWELRQARAVSEDGKTIAGWGLHNGVEEGWVARINSPPPTGACCVRTGFGVGSCSIMTQSACADTPGGSYLGDGSVCGLQDGNCDFCPQPFADADANGSVDQRDFGFFQACYAGFGHPVPPGCECFDQDNDGQITQLDFNRFTACWSGPAIPLDPACAD